MPVSLLNLLHNQLVGGALLLTLSGGVVATLYRVPGKIWNLVQRQLVVSVDVLDRDEGFTWLSYWLDNHPRVNRLRALTITTRNYGTSAVPYFAPGVGTHMMWHGYRPFWVVRTRSEVAAGVTESLRIWTFGRSQAFLRKVVQEAQELAKRPDGRIHVYISKPEYWQRATTIDSRKLSSVVLPDGQGETIAADIRQFINQREWYEEHGIPWRRGYLFHGLPGTGKSSLVRALAGAIGFDLYVLNIAGSGMSDDGLLHLLGSMPVGAALLLEDLDAVTNDRTVLVGGGANPSTVTFTGLLNALDGVASQTGILLFMTTNHLEKLDSALIRPGRCDVKVEFTHATTDQIVTLIQTLYEDVSDSVAHQFAASLKQHNPAITMAEVQHLALQNKAELTQK